MHIRSAGMALKFGVLDDLKKGMFFLYKKTGKAFYLARLGAMSVFFFPCHIVPEEHCMLNKLFGQQIRIADMPVWLLRHKAKRQRQNARQGKNAPAREALDRRGP